MPTYVCTVRAGALATDERAAIVAAISAAHAEATGAPSYLVQIVFTEAPAGSRFIGGQPSDDHVFVRGDIRAGRSVEARTGLGEAIAARVAAIIGLKASDVWVYLNELAPTDMIEFGRVLPSPGDEAAWFDALPQELRVHLGNLQGKRPDS